MSVSYENWIASNDLAPTDKEQMRRRALYYATAISMDCAEMLSVYMAHCKGAKFHERNGAMTEPKIEENKRAIKELVCQSIYLMLVEQGGNECPNWLKEFARWSWAAADKLMSEPSSKSVMDKYKSFAGIEDNCQATSFNLCSQLALGDTKPDALVMLGQLLEARKEERIKHLSIALSESLDSLDKRIAGPEKRKLIPDISFD